MMFKQPLRTLGFALAGMLLIGAAAETALNTLEMRALPSDRANRQVHRDLLSILRPIGRISSGNMRRVGDVWMHTKASATDYRSLCQRDTLSLNYALVEQGEPIEQVPLRPVSLNAERSYRFVAKPKPEYLEEANRDGHYRSPFASECRRADRADDNNEWEGWFVAESPELALAGGFAMLAVQEWAKAPGHEFASCRPDDRLDQCKAKHLFELDLQTIGAVGECKADRAGEICITLGRWSYDLTIKARDTGKPMSAGDILSVDYQIVIIVT